MGALEAILGFKTFVLVLQVASLGVGQGLGLSLDAAAPTALALQAATAVLVLVRCRLGVQTRRSFRLLILALALEGLVNVLALAMFFSLQGKPRSSALMWGASFFGGASYLLMVQVATVLVCWLRRPLLRQLLETLVDRGLILPPPPDAPAAVEGVVSCPATIFLLPAVASWSFVSIPSLAVLGTLFLDGSRVGPQAWLALFDGAAGVVSTLFLASAAVLEDRRAQYLGPVTWAAVSFTLLYVAGRAQGVGLVVAESDDASSAWRLNFASSVIFFEGLALWVAFMCVAMAGRIDAAIWSKLGAGIWADFVTHEDSRAAGEASIGAVLGGTALTILVVPLDVAALVKCGQDDGVCDAYTRIVLWVVYTSNVVYMLSTVACVVYTRMRCPPSLIVKVGCLSNQLLWVLNVKESAVLLTTFVLLVFEFVVACDRLHAKSTSGVVRALLITSGTFRLLGFLVSALVDLTTRTDRSNAFTNALGTVVQLNALRSIADVEIDNGGVNPDEIYLEGQPMADGGQYGSFSFAGPDVQGWTGVRHVDPEGRVVWTAVSALDGSGPGVKERAEDLEAEGAAAAAADVVAGAADAADAIADPGITAALPSEPHVSYAFVRQVDQPSGRLEWRDGAAAIAENDRVAITSLSSSAAWGRGADLASIASSPFETKHRWFRSAIARSRVPWEMGHETIVCRRERLLDESFPQWSKIGAVPTSFRKIFRFTIDDRGHRGLDAGGVAREYFSSLVDSLFEDGGTGKDDTGSNSSTGGGGGGGGDAARPRLFVRGTSAEAVTYQIRPHPHPEKLDRSVLRRYRFAGQVLAKAVYDGHTVAAHLSRPILAHLTGLPTCPNDLCDYDDALHRQLEWLRALPESEAETAAAIEDLCLDFTVAYSMEGWGDAAAGVVSTELCPKGTERAVDLASRAEYVELRWRQRVLYDVGPQLGALLAGLYDVIEPGLFSVFTPEELDRIFCGEVDVDVDDWREHTEYIGFRGGFRGGSQRVVGWWWDAVDSFDQRQRKRLLRFVTGSAGVPVGGMGRLLGNDGRLAPFTIQALPKSKNGHPEAFLPRAHTCFNRIDLPLYESKAQLREVLLGVISDDHAISGFMDEG